MNITHEKANEHAKLLRKYMIDSLTTDGVWDGQHDIPTEEELTKCVLQTGQWEPMPEELYDGSQFDMPEQAMAALCAKPGPGWILGNGDLYCYSGDAFMASYFRFVRKPE